MEGEAPSDELKQLEVPFISDAQCFEKVPAEFRPFLTTDKICAGFFEKNTSVCEGDSGGGLVFYRNQTEEFYLRGIVSTSPQREGSCDSRQYGAYTRVSHHLEFIEIEIKNSSSDFRCKSGQRIDKGNLCDGKPDCSDNSDETREVCGGDIVAQIRSCIVPKYPANGKWIIRGSTVLPPGQRISNYGLIFIECTKRFKPYPNVTHMFCNQGTWSPPNPPECLPVCANITSFLSTGSDEYPSLCGNITSVTPFPTTSITTTATITKGTTRAEAQIGSCVVPNYPANGKLIIGAWTAEPPPGQRISNYGVIFIECKKRFKPYPDVRFMICNKGAWSPPNPPECSPVCSNLTSSLSTEITCTLDGMQVPCIDPVAGTVASYSCNFYYDDISIDQPPQIVCKDGSWDYQFLQCVAICGKKSARGVTNIIHGNRTKKGDYPWQVGLYKTSDNEHICGGFILTESIVISAVHCVADYQGNPHPKENYWLAAGKYYRALGDERDKDTEQKTAITNTYLSPRYRGVERNFESDLALLIVQKPFIFSTFVQPICIDWRKIYENEQLIDNNIGIVVGWGYTKEGETPADELKQLQVPFISEAQCFDQAPAEFKPYITTDKICAGFLERNTSVCQGDTGGGLVFYRNQTEKFYLRGIVSTSPRRESSCDSRQYGFFTRVSDHLDFIKDIIYRKV